MMNGSFWVGALERAVKTAAQSLLSLWLVGDVAFNLLSIDWGASLGVAAGAAVLSLLSSIVSKPFGPEGSPSLVHDGS